MFTYSWYNARMKQFFRAFDLTAKQYNILRILKGAGRPVSTSFIRERLLDKMSDVSRIVDRMHDKQLISKSVCAMDKRLVDVGLTEKGKEKLDEVKNQANKMDQMLSHLNEDEARQLNDLLDKLRGN